jgi:hypothetical protein
MAYSFLEAWVEWISLQAASASDSSGDDKFIIGINVNDGAQVPEVRLGMLIGWLESAVVLVNDGVKEWSKQRIGLSIWSINANTTVQVLHA